MNSRLSASVMTSSRSNGLVHRSEEALENSDFQEDPDPAEDRTLQPPLEGNLTASEQRSLQECEAVVSKGWQTFVEVGKALAIIRNDCLYRHDYRTFEDYCRKKWQYHRSYAYRLIAAAELVTHLSPKGDKSPKQETQVRPLLGLPLDQASAAWNRAVVAAEGGEVTANLVKKAAAEFRKREAATKKQTKPPKKQAQLNSLLLRETLELVKKAEDFVQIPQNPSVMLSILAEIKNNLFKLGQ